MSGEEIITAYPLHDPTDVQPMVRKKFYDQQIQAFKEHGQPTVAVGIFDVLLFTEQKEIILQKRSGNKRHNPYLIDKSVGGHIQYGDSPFYTAMIESVQELRVPSVVLRQHEDFTRTHSILRESLESTSILELIDTKIFHLTKIIDEEPITIANHVHLFFGVYSGPMKPVDREASGILYYKLDDLREEMKRMPDLFTNDLHVFLTEYEDRINEFLKVVD